MRKKVLLGLLCVVLLLAAVMGVNMVMNSSKQLKLQPAAPLVFDEATALERFAGALRYKTLTGPDDGTMMPVQDKAEFLRLHRYLAKSFPRTHASLKLEKVNELTLLYTWQGRNKNLKPVLFVSHIDVVPVETSTENKWTHGAFSGAVC